MSRCPESLESSATGNAIDSPGLELGVVFEDENGVRVHLRHEGGELAEFVAAGKPTRGHKRRKKKSYTKKKENSCGSCEKPKPGTAKLKIMPPNRCRPSCPGGTAVRLRGSKARSTQTTYLKHKKKQSTIIGSIQTQNRAPTARGANLEAHHKRETCSSTHTIFFSKAKRRTGKGGLAKNARPEHARREKHRR